MVAEHFPVIVDVMSDDVLRAMWKLKRRGRRAVNQVLVHDVIGCHSAELNSLAGVELAAK